MEDKLWHSRKIEDIYNQLNTSEKGLSNAEAKKRLEKYGPNKLPRGKRDSALKIIVRQFLNPIIYILIIAVILCLIIGKNVDAIFIMAVILLNVILGAFQEWKAGKNSESLQKLIKVNVKVLRDKVEKKIDSEDVVIGDIVYLEPGDKISADLRLISAKNLTVEEAVLTGESIAANKNTNILSENELVADRNNMAYAGTSVTTGRGIGIVVATGVDTEIGKIASNVLLSHATKSPLVIRMEKFTKQISYVVFVIAIFLTIILYFKGYDMSEMFFVVVGLAVSAIPEGLPVALILVLSIASVRMSKRNVIVKRLNSVESLGSCTVIASDKTGTLTLNEQTAKKVVLPDNRVYDVEGIGYNANGKVLSVDGNNDFNDVTNLSILGAINNDASLTKNGKKWSNYGDSIDVAFLALSRKLGVSENIKKEKNIVGSIPYESENQYSAVFYKEDKNTYCTAKGSLEKILDFCDTMEVNGKKEKIDKEFLMNQNNELASNGYRVIAICNGTKQNFKTKNVYDNEDIPKMSLVGLVGFIDPIREETVDSINKCHEAGIKVIMITGDHPLTAFNIAKELKMVSNMKHVANGEEIDKYINLGEEEFDKYMSDKIVFSRVTPIQKLEIVESLKRQGHFVAVTGDGVNDAPAMKSSNIGIAMGSGTDVAKETGTMIIVDDNFLSIVAGIEEGRNAYSNIRKVIYLLISTGFAEVIFFITAILLNFPIPLIAVQILWLNLVTNGIQDAALAFEKGEPGAMKRKPREPNEKIFNKLLIQETVVSGLTIAIIVFTFWIYLINIVNMEVSIARGYILLLMVLIQNFHVFNCRSERTSAFKIPLRNNPFIVFGVIASLILQVLITINPFFSEVLSSTAIPLTEVPKIILIASPVLMVMEIFKIVKFRKERLVVK